MHDVPYCTTADVGASMDVIDIALLCSRKRSKRALHLDRSELQEVHGRHLRFADSVARPVERDFNAGGPIVSTQTCQRLRQEEQFIDRQDRLGHEAAMTRMTLTEYLGADVKALLESPPFSGWEVTRSTEQDLPRSEVWYEFHGHGVEVICDEAERIRTIFLHRGDGESLFEIPFSLRRQEILERYGSPSKSRGAARIPVLGDRGAWDRFTLPAASIHVQYRLDRDEIEMITLMSPDAVP